MSHRNTRPASPLRSPRYPVPPQPTEPRGARLISILSKSPNPRPKY